MKNEACAFRAARMSDDKDAVEVDLAVQRVGRRSIPCPDLLHVFEMHDRSAFSPVIPLDGSVGLGPYRFGLTAAAAIAPTDQQYVPLTGPTVVPDC